MPVIWVKANIYLLGSEKHNCDLKAENVVVRTGGGYESFQAYIVANEKFHQKILVNHMINNDQSLEWVVDQLIQGKKLKGPMQSQNLKI